MNDIRKRDPEKKLPTHKNSSSKVRQKISALQKVTSRFIRKNKHVLMLVCIVLGVVLTIFGVYRFGYMQGEQAQKQANEKLLQEARKAPTSSFDAFRNRTTSKSLTGTIESVSASSIKIKPRNGDAQTVVVNDETIVTDAKNKRTDVKALKKGSMVIISTATQDDKTLARRIRVLPEQQ